jgi:hypothetical protein
MIETQCWQRLLPIELAEFRVGADVHLCSFPAAIDLDDVIDELDQRIVSGLASLPPCQCERRSVTFKPEGAWPTNGRLGEDMRMIVTHPDQTCHFYGEQEYARNPIASIPLPTEFETEVLTALLELSEGADRVVSTKAIVNHIWPKARSRVTQRNRYGRVERAMRALQRKGMVSR